MNPIKHLPNCDMCLAQVPTHGNLPLPTLGIYDFQAKTNISPPIYSINVPTELLSLPHKLFSFTNELHS